MLRPQYQVLKARARLVPVGLVPGSVLTTYVPRDKQVSSLSVCHRRRDRNPKVGPLGRDAHVGRDERRLRRQTSVPQRAARPLANRERCGFPLPSSRARIDLDGRARSCPMRRFSRWCSYPNDRVSWPMKDGSEGRVSQRDEDRPSLPGFGTEGEASLAVHGAHDHSFRNRAELLAGRICGCFYCYSVFAPERIEEWTDDSIPQSGRSAVHEFHFLLLHCHRRPVTLPPHSAIPSQGAHPVVRSNVTLPDQSSADD